MALNINLLPSELSVGRSLNNFLKTIKAIGVIAMAGFLIFGLGIGAFLFFSKITLDNLNTKVSTLKSQISTQEKSEQQIILLKDRLQKINSIYNWPNSSKNLEATDIIVSSLSNESTVTHMKVVSKGVNLSLNIKNVLDLSSFLASVKNSKTFTDVKLTSFNMSSTNGYGLEVLMNK